MKNNPEYQQLLQLRNAIVGKQQAEQGIQETTRKMNALQFTLPPPEKRPPITLHVDTLIRQFEEPEIKAAKAKAWKRDGKTNGVKNFFLVLLSLLVLAAGGFLIYVTAIWSWNTSITSMLSKPYMGQELTYPTVVGIHLFALSLLGLVSALFLGGYAADGPIFSTVLFIILAVGTGIGSIVALVSSFRYFYSMVEGFWETFLLVLGSLLAIPKFLWAVLLILPLFIVFTGTPILMAMILKQCAGRIKKRVNTYVKPDIDRTELYQSAGYREAEERDRKATANDLAIYREYYDKTKMGYFANVNAHRNAIERYRAVVSDCNRTIRASDILHDQQKTLQCVNMILYYFESRRAISIREALNLYIQDQHMLRMEKQLSDLQRNTMRTIRESVNSMTRRLDAMESTISRDIANINGTLKNQTASFEKSIDKLRNDNNANAQRMIEAEKRTASELSYLYYETRLQRKN